MQLGLLEPKAALTSAFNLVDPEITAYGGDIGFLRSNAPIRPDGRAAVTAFDLFAGGGGLSLGTAVAAAQRGRRLNIVGAIENDDSAASVYRKNFSVETFERDVREVFGTYGSPLTLRERRVRAAHVDLLLAGPPCQGNSDLNNYTRRKDHRNQLYFTVARAAEVLRPRHVIIENVPGVRHDRKGVANQTAAALQQLGYNVIGILLNAADFGVAQYRKRFFLIASRDALYGLPDLIEQHKLPLRPLSWAIGDLSGRCDVTSLTDSPGETKGANRDRIRYLFEAGLYDLPDAKRPPCHSEKDHSYKSVYGRLHWDKPAQTITRGFFSVCMGRYVHPDEPRSITAHEAARIQFIPDYFSLTPARSKTALAKIIGNVVPPKLSYVIVQSLLLIEAIGAHR